MSIWRLSQTKTDSKNFRRLTGLHCEFTARAKEKSPGLQTEYQKELEELVLTKRPFETLKLFALAILQYLKQLALYVGQLAFSFWRFFTPTIIGKATIKTHIQTLFIILVCNNQLVEWLIWILNHVPALSYTSAHFMAKLQSLRERFNNNHVIPSKTSKAEHWNFSFAFMWNTFIWLMLMGFFKNNNQVHKVLKMEVTHLRPLAH